MRGSVMRRLQIWHETRYDFAVPVELRDHQLMLRPREGHDVRVESSKLLISPLPRISWQRATQAWAEVYLPGAGWKGFDPTIGRLAGGDHIPVAVARRPEAVPPVAGSFVGPGSARPVLQVRVSVMPL
jgi:hypothetical protein